MHEPRGQWPLRIAGTLFGAGCLLVAGFSLLGGGAEVSELGRDRAFGFGVCALVVGIVAIVGSLTSDARRLWYCVPRRWRPFRDDLLDAWDARPTTPAAITPAAITPTDDASEGPRTGRTRDRR